MSAVAVTACPAVPSLTPSPEAIGYSRLAGRNSPVTSAKTPTMRATTPPQDAWRSGVGAAERADAAETAGTDDVSEGEDVSTLILRSWSAARGCAEPIVRGA